MAHPQNILYCSYIGRTSYCCHGSLTGLHLRHGPRGPLEESRCPMHISNVCTTSIGINNIPYSRDYKYPSIIRTPQIQVPI